MSTQEAIKARLSEFDIIVAVDTSGSMGEPVKAGSDITRWEAVQESAMSIIREVEKIDSDGLGLVLFGGRSGIVSQDGVKSSNFRSIFADVTPGGSTPLAEALTAAFKLAGKSEKKDLIVVFTDGAPDDQKKAAQVIIDQSQKQAADDELTVLFIQVGDDPRATAYLKGLDDNLTGAKFDIVDVKTVEEADKFASIPELLVAAIEG